MGQRQAEAESGQGDIARKLNFEDEEREIAKSNRRDLLR